MLMAWASYAGPGWSQADPSDLTWRTTKVFLSTSKGEVPTKAMTDEWLELLPESPARRGLVWPGLDVDDPRRTERTKKADAYAGTRNAQALQNRLRRAGWLQAEVEATWAAGRRSCELQLWMNPGDRWFLDSVVWRTEGSGLSTRRVKEVAQINPGDPFEMSLLQDAQDRVAAYAQSLGYTTFHTGHVLFEVDTLSRSAIHRAALTVKCLPWDASTAAWSASSGVNVNALLPHPLVHIGRVTWNGTPPNQSTNPAGLRNEVWDHLVRMEPGQVHKPTQLSLSYSGLAGLRAIQKVNLTQTMRWDTSATEVEVGLPGQALMDVDFSVIPKASHDIGVGLDMVRNDARYGPKLSTTLLHRNPRGWGAENAWEVAFGYVAVSPFSSLNRQTLLNSGEWTVRWRTRQIGIVPLPLEKFRPSSSPFTSMDVGWDREVWPEFTRSQFHVQHDVGFTENPNRASQVRFSPVDVSFVNLSNRDSAFVAWLVNQGNPLIQARFNNHLTLGSSAAWETGWGLGLWDGRCQIQTSWAGMLAQRAANLWAAPEKLDEATGAWLVTADVPLVQHQRILTSVSAKRPFAGIPNSEFAGHVLMGWANAGANTPSLPLEQAFFTGGANGVRGWRMRTLGPGNVSSLDSSVAILGLGDVRLDVQLEWRHAFNSTWSMAAFTDAGNVWLHGDEAPLLASFRGGTWSSVGWSMGAGVRYDLEFFLLRLDAGLRLHDPSQAEGQRWVGQHGLRGALHLGLGMPF